MRIGICILAALLCSGCFAFDELDKGREIMDHYSVTDKAKPEPAKVDLPDAEGKTARQRLAEYYARQRAQAAPPSASKDPADEIGGCRIAGSVQFLRRTDCQLRGGTFL